MDKLVWHNQIVIPISGTVKNEFFIVYDKLAEKKCQRFVAAKDCKFVITESESDKVQYELHFDLKDSCEIRSVVGYEALFNITDTGILISRRKHKVLSQTLSKSGYYNHMTRVGGRNGKCVLLRIHRCVAEAFILNTHCKPFVNHMDGVKVNNDRSNLEWVTAKENAIHAHVTGLQVNPKGFDNPLSIFNEEDVNVIKRLSTVYKFSGRKIARLFKVNKSTVQRIVNSLRYV